MFKIYDGRNQFYQWDLDRKLIVEDKTISQVHFCNRTDDCSLVCEVYEENGLTLVNVPNILLQEDWRINVYAYDGKHTKHSEQFDVVRRSKPESYVYTETEVLNYSVLLDRMEGIEENIGDAVKDYLEENNIQVDLTGYATETYVNDAIRVIELTPGPVGPIGETGPKGEDGYTPIKGVDYFDGAPGTPGKDGANGKDGKDGYTPIKGVDYFDGAPGEPGYTPVKGVDYFDGKDGADGAPGKDGKDGEPGPAGKDGEDGKDYVLTEEDKAEIAAMVDVSGGDVDLSGYYTKEEIDDMLANLPAGDIPSGEEVKF